MLERNKSLIGGSSLKRKEQPITPITLKTTRSTLDCPNLRVVGGCGSFRTGRNCPNLNVKFDDLGRTFSRGKCALLNRSVSVDSNYTGVMKPEVDPAVYLAGLDWMI